MGKKDGGPIDLESLRGILKDEQQGAQMEGPLTDEELVSLSEHCCYPDGILGRVIAELTTRRARDAEVEALVAADLELNRAIEAAGGFVEEGYEADSYGVAANA